MRPESAALLWDVQNAAVRIESFLAGLTLETYVTDDLRRSAVERQFLIVGEALNALRRADPTTADQIPDLARIIGLRNVLAHGYAIVDDAVVWQAATGRLPELTAAVSALLENSRPFNP